MRDMTATTVDVVSTSSSTANASPVAVAYTHLKGERIHGFPKAPLNNLKDIKLVQ